MSNRKTRIFDISSAAILIFRGYSANDIGYKAFGNSQIIYPNFDAKKLNDKALREPTDKSMTPFPISSLYKGRQLETESLAIRTVTLLDFLAAGEIEIEWIVDGLFPATSVSIIAGAPASGKSWMLLDLAIECARGGRWLGRFDTAIGKVLYIDEESSPSLLRRRTHKLLAAKGITGEGLELHFAVGQGVNFSNKSRLSGLISLIKRIRPTLIIIDSLIRVHRAEENSASEMARVFGVIKKIVRFHKCSFVIADHTRKPGREFVSPEFLLRGSSEKAAFVDTLLSVECTGDKVIVRHTKSRFAENTTPFFIQIVDPTTDSTTVNYVGEAGISKKRLKLDKVLKLIISMLKDNEAMPRKSIVNMANDHEYSEKLVDEALKILQDEGRIERNDRKNDSGRGGKSAYFRVISMNQPNTGLEKKPEPGVKAERHA